MQMDHERNYTEKKANPKRLQTVRIHVDNILEMTKIPEAENGRLAAQGQNCSHKRATGGASCEGTHVCDDRIHVTLGHDTLVLQKIIIGGNWVKGTQELQGNVHLSQKEKFNLLKKLSHKLRYGVTVSRRGD